MRSIPQAMLWEFLWNGRWGLLAAVLGANALQTFLFSALRLQGEVDFSDPSYIGMHVALMPISTLIFGAAVFAAQGSISRLFAHPVPTSTLVTWHMFPAMGAIVIESVASTALLNATFGLEMPVWGPALFVAVAVASLQATLWLTEGTEWLVALALGVVAAVLGLWFKSRYGGLFSSPSHFWYLITPQEVVTLLTATVVAYTVARVGVARKRRGESPFSLGLGAWFERVWNASGDERVPVGSAVKAHTWYEWRQKGWVLPTIVLGGLAVAVGAWVVISRDLHELIRVFIGAGPFLAIGGGICGMLIGHSNAKNPNLELGHWLATRPMASSVMARIILKVTATSVFITWILWVVAFLTVYLALWASRLHPEAALPGWFRWWYFPAILLGTWGATALATSLFLTGRGPLMAQFICASVGLLIGLMLLSLYVQFAMSMEAALQFRQAGAAVCGVALILGSTAALLAARIRGLNGWWGLLIAIGLWLALSALVPLEWEWIRTRAEPVSTSLFVIGLLGLTIAPVATVPLAVAWNRTR